MLPLKQFYRQSNYRAVIFLCLFGGSRINGAANKSKPLRRLHFCRLCTSSLILRYFAFFVLYLSSSLFTSSPICVYICVHQLTHLPNFWQEASIFCLFCHIFKLKCRIWCKRQTTEIFEEKSFMQSRLLGKQLLQGALADTPYTPGTPCAPDTPNTQDTLVWQIHQIHQERSCSAANVNNSSIFR